MKWGLISKLDSETLMKTLDMVMKMCPKGMVYTTSIGIFDGDTDRSINQYITNRGRANVHTAIDNNKDKEVLKPFPECNLIIGNSNEVYNQLKDNSQHLIFVDGNHSFPYVISDFFCYADKVKQGGYMAFHDTGSHIREFKDYQGIGNVLDADMYISVRKALCKIGLLWEEDSDLFIDRYAEEWELVFDQADKNDEAGGFCVFKKLY